MNVCSRIPSRLWPPVAAVSQRTCALLHPNARGLSLGNQRVKPMGMAPPPLAISAAASRRTAEAGHRKRQGGPESKSFRDLLEREDLVTAVEEAGLLTATEIQAKGIPAILSGRDVVLASHTGSGKTLAYLLPIIEMLKKNEAGTEPKTKRPRVLVLGPTRELTDQILHVAKSLSHHSKFRSTHLNAGGKWKTQREKLALPQDLVVATPSRLKEHVQARNIFFGDVEFLVLDEADTMFDAGFGPEVKKIVEILSKKETKCQFVLVAATMGKNIRRLVKNTFTDILTVETSSLHKGVQGCEHRFFPLKPGTDKLTQLHQILESDIRNSRRVMIFCNTMDSCRAAEHTLAELGIQTLCYHGEMPIEARKENIRRFSGLARNGEEMGGVKEPGVMVCTDLAARGLDIPQKIDHVINFDFPRTSVDYIHRGGRTARAGASGKVTSLLGPKDRTLGDRIKWAVLKNLPLDELSGRKQVVPPSMRSTEQKKSQKQVRSESSMKGMRGASRATVMKERSKKAAQAKAALKKLKRKRNITRGIKARTLRNKGLRQR